MDIKFEPFDYTSQLVQQRKLFQDSFPETEGEAIQHNEHYFWKFQSFPNEVKSWEYVAKIEDEFAGYYAALPYRYKIGSKTTPVGMVCDVMTSPNFRGKGIFTKLGRYSTSELSKNVPFTMGYPIRKEVIPGHLKIGWKIPFSLPLYMKFLRLNALLKSKKLGFLAPIANLCVNIYNLIVHTKINKSYSYTVADNIDDVKDYDDFVNKWLNVVQNALIKDQDFARWRYGAPERKYQFLSVYNSVGEMTGFVSFRKIIKEGVPSYGILDYMVLPESNDCHGFIINTLTRIAKKDQVEAMMAMMSKYAATNYQLCKNGFFRSPFVFELIIKNLTKEFSEKDLFNENNWHLMWVDSDDL